MKNSFFLILSITLLLSNSIVAQSWTVHNCGIPDAITHISFPTIDTGYAFAGTGQMKVTNDGAQTWSSTSIPDSITLTQMQFTTGQKGFMAGDSSVYRTLDGGANWTRVLNDGQVYIVSMYFVNTSTGYVGGWQNTGDSIRIYKTTDGGSTWAMVSKVVCYIPEQSLYFTNPSTGFSGTNFNILSTTNGASTFSTVYTDAAQTDDIIDIDFPNTDTGYAVSAANALLQSTDGGMTWAPMTYPTTITYKLHFFDGKHGLACGGNGVNSGGVMQTTNGGSTWTSSYSSVNSFYSMDFPANSVGYAGGDNGAVLKYSNAPNGIAGAAEQNLVSFYPNPSSGLISVQAEIMDRENLVLAIFDLTGRPVSAWQLISSQDVTTLDISMLSNGTYICRVMQRGVILQTDRINIGK